MGLKRPTLVAERHLDRWSGIFRYEDVFRPGIEHETRICHRYVTWVEGRDPFFKLDGPLEYNKET